MISSPSTTTAVGSGDVAGRILAAAATRRPNGLVEVTGDGELATEVRGALAAVTDSQPRNAGRPAGAPACIVDTTGQPEVIEAALTRLADLGLLVLAGPVSELALDLYPDVHVRGLRLVGIEPLKNREARR